MYSRAAKIGTTGRESKIRLTYLGQTLPKENDLKRQRRTEFAYPNIHIQILGEIGPEGVSSERKPSASGRRRKLSSWKTKHRVSALWGDGSLIQSLLVCRAYYAEENPPGRDSTEREKNFSQVFLLYSSK